MFWRHTSSGSRVSGSRTCDMWMMLQERGLLTKMSTGRWKSDTGNIVTLRRRRRQRLVCLLNIASDVSPKACLSIALCLHADFGVGLMCVHKPDASCGECHKQKTKCEYPGKTSIRVGLPTKGQPVVMYPTPKCESLKVRCHDVMMQDEAN